MWCAYFSCYMLIYWFQLPYAREIIILLQRKGKNKKANREEKRRVLLIFCVLLLNLPIFHICIAGELDGRDYSLTFWITTFFNIHSFSKISQDILPLDGIGSHSYFFSSFARMNLYTMDRLLNFFTLIFTLLLCISCNNDEMLKVMDQINSEE